MKNANPLVLAPNLTDADGFYAALVAAHEELSESQSEALTQRLVFLLANQIGDQAQLEACIAEARKPFTKES